MIDYNQNLIELYIYNRENVKFCFKAESYIDKKNEQMLEYFIKKIEEEAFL